MSVESKGICPRLVYSAEYDIHFLGLENLHPFDSRKYSRAWKVLRSRFGDRLDALTLTPTAPANNDVLRLVHPENYLHQLRRSRYVAKALELSSLGMLPISILDSRVLRPMRLATMGTILAAEAALASGMAINLSGGYHHASPERGEGFCIYADVAIAIAQLRQSHQIAPDDPILIIDLDAHQGNGLARVFLDDPSVHILDMYNCQIYPCDSLAISRINCKLPLAAGSPDAVYLTQLRQHLPRFLESIPPPKIAFYNAGTDIYEYDPLGCLGVSQEGILERDRFVFHTLTEAGIPWVMVLSGGYTRESYQLVADSVTYALETFTPSPHYPPPSAPHSAA
jgi:histone deacetylase 11